jgi:CRP/FNR family transcriptional regulator, cyclic AMP receptor protein
MTTLLPLLSADDREALASIGRPRRVPRGAWLMSEGEPIDTVVIVLRGRVKISTVTAEGTEVVCAVHGAGSVVGHYEALDGDSAGRAASAIALETVECRVLDAEDFRTFLKQRPEAAMALLRALVRDLRAANRRRSDVAAGDTTRHLARFLLEQLDLRHEAGATNGHIDVGLSQAELGGVVSASRAAVVRSLSALRKMGAVETSPRQIVVLDVAALRRAAH